MARSLNGSTNAIVCTPGAFASSAFDYGTVAFIVLKDSTGDWREILASNGFFFGVNPGGEPTGGWDNSSDSGSSAISTATWYLIVGVKGTGSVAPIWYRYNYTSTTWTTNTPAGAQANGSTNITQFNLGHYPGPFEHWDGDVAAIGIYRHWVPANLAAVQAASLETDADNWVSAAANADKAAVWIFNQASAATQLTDATGGGADESSSNQGTVVSGPAGFDETLAGGPTPQPGDFVQQLGTAVSNSNGTTLAISFTGATKPAVGDLVVFYCARDNTTNDPATGDTFDDGEGNTYTRVALAQPSGTSTAAAGIVGVMFYTVVTSAWTDNQTLTWTLPSRTGKVMLAEHYQGPIRGLRGTADTAGSTTSVSVLTTDPLAGDLVVAMSAYEHSATSTVTADSDTTNGAWSTQTTQLASGGTTGAAVKVVAQHKLVTATGNQSYATSNSTNVDNVGIVATFIPGYPYRGRQPTQAARGSAINSNFY